MEETEELLIQKYLRGNGENASFQFFRDELHLMIKEAEDGCRVLFKYNQIESPLGNPICQEARGLILDRGCDWDVVSWPFRKFFNHGEGHAAPIDLSTAVILEKIDGTCITMYFWLGQWRTQTLGMIDAEGCVNNIFPPATFNELFHRTLGVDITLGLNPYYTYTFELATPYNRIVTRYEKERIVLLSIRDVLTLKEVPWGSNIFKSLYLELNVKVLLNAKVIIDLPEIYPVAVTSLKEVATMASQLPQMSEGYVVVDNNFNRVKVKNPSYLALLHLKDSSTSSVKALVELILKNEGSEFLAYFPEFKSQYDRLSELITKIKDKLKEVWENTKEIKNQKEFALAVLATGVPFNNILFALRNGRTPSVEEGMRELDAKRVVEALKLEDGQ